MNLADPELESTNFNPLGLPIIRPAPDQKYLILSNPKSKYKLENYQLIGVNIELDDQVQTKEYLFTPDNSCLKPNTYKSKPFWILQQVGNQKLNLIIHDSAYQVRIWKKEAGIAKRRIETILKGSVPSRYTKKPIAVRCHSQWRLTDKSYTYQHDYVEIYRTDSSTRSSAWIIVDGQELYASVDQNYRCTQ